MASLALETLIAVDARRVPQTPRDLSIAWRRSTAKTRRYASPELLWHNRPMSPCGHCQSELRTPTNARSGKLLNEADPRVRLARYPVRQVGSRPAEVRNDLDGSAWKVTRQ